MRSTVRFLLALSVVVSGSLLPGRAGADAGCVVGPDPGRNGPDGSGGMSFLVQQLEDRGGIAVLEFDGDYDRLLADDTLNAAARQEVAQAFYSTHGDEYDFLLVVTDFEFDTSPALAVHWRVQNQVEGLGIPLFDSSAEFGSDGRLVGYVDLAALSRYSLEPGSGGFEQLLQAAAHELLHTWGAEARFLDSGGNPSTALTTGESHWSYLFDSQASLLYGNDWRDNGDGTFTSLAVEKLWGPLDLYLAGLIGPEEVPPLLLIDNGTIDPRLRGHAGDVIPGDAVAVTIEDIVAAEGPRSPAASESPHEFRAAVLYLVRPGSEPGQAELMALEAFRHELEIRLAILTGGRATFETFLEPPGGSGGGGGPTPIDPGDLRPGSASLEDALAWLRSRQTAEGFWQDKPETRLRDTAVASGVLSEIDALFDGGAAAAAWLGAQTLESSDYEARRFGALAALLPGSPSAAGLLARQNADGGWGPGAGFASDPLDSAIAVSELLAGSLAPAHPALVRAGDFLLAAQNPDGGWGAVVDGASRSAPTASALSALAGLGRAADAAGPAIAWLASRQNADGGFGDSPSTAHDTSLAIEAARAVEGAGAIDLAAAVAFLDSHQTVAGSWEGSVYTTALVAATLSRTAFPDLMLLEPEADPLDPVAGEPVRVLLRPRNAGAVAAPATALRLFDGDPDAGGTQIGSDLAVPELEPFEQTELELDWDTGGADPGTHTLVAVADATEVVVEASETNNRASVAVEVRPAPDGPDLAVRDDGIAFLPPHPTTLPVEVAVVVTVRNLGNEDVAEVAVRAFRGEPTSGLQIGEELVALPARSSLPVSFFDTVTEPGSVLYSIVVDPDDLVIEADETNNRAAASLSTQPSIDLEVLPEDLSLLSPDVYPGADVQFRAILRNRGTAGGGSFEAVFTVTDGVTTRELQRSTLQLEPGESAERVLTWRVDLEGDLTFVAEIDPEDLVPEGDETNNLAGLDFVSAPVPAPNFAVAPSEFTIDPDPAHEGSSIELSILVRNNGGVTAAPARVAFYDGDPSAGLEIASADLPELAAGASIPLVATWDEVPDAADRIFHLVVDPEDVVAEYSEEDNATFRVVEVLSLPDLIVTSGGLQLEPAFPIPNEPVTLTAQVANGGEQEGSPVLVRAYLGDPGAGGSLLAETTLVSVPGQSTGEAVLGWTFTEPVQQATLFVLADPDGVVRESDESNNSATLPLTVQNQDLYVSAPYFSPNGDGELDTTTFGFRLDGGTAVAVEIRDSKDRLLRRFEDAQWSGGEGQLEWDGRDEAGAVARDGEVRFLAVDAVSGAPLGQAPATLDTNRLSLLAAAGTPYESVRNATCELPDLQDARPTADGRTAFVLLSSTFGGGIYRVSTENGSYAQVVNREQLAVPGPIACDREILGTSMVVAPDGSRVAFATRRELPCPSRRELFVVDASGSELVQLPQTGASAPYPLGFHDGSRSLLAQSAEDDSLLTIPLVDPALAHSIFPDANSLWWAYQDESFFFSPDRRRLLLFTPGAPDGTRAWLLDLETESSRLLVELESELWGWRDAAWSFDGLRLVVNDRDPGRVHVFDSAGDPVATYLVQPEPPEDWYTQVRTFLSRARTSSREVALGVEWDTGDSRQDQVLLLDLADGGLRHVAWTEASGGGGGALVGGGERPGARIGPEPESARRQELRALLAERRDARRAAGPGDPDAPPMDPRGGENPDGELLPAGYEPVWVPFDRALLWTLSDRFGYPGNPTAILLEENDLQMPLLPDWDLFEFPRFGPSGQELFFESDQDTVVPDGPCAGDGWGLDLFTYRSLLNLGAELRATPASPGQGFLLEGSAADRNFLRYRLDFAPATDPTAWSPLAPAVSTEAFDEPLATWVPPAPGTWLVRLTVEDRAGNRRSIHQRVSSSATPSVTDFWVTPEVVSPNGDGVLDAATIHYRTLQPLHVEVRVLDDRGVLVRSFLRSHAQPEVGEIAWDGRDENGQSVADGLYRVQLQDLEQWIEVDTTPPTITLGWGVPPRLVCLDPGVLPGSRFAAWSQGLVVLAADPPHETGPGTELEVGVGADPVTWSPAQPLPGEVPSPECEPHCPGISVGDYVNRSYRATATDLGGNERVEVLGLGPEAIDIGAIKLEQIDPVTGLPSGWSFVGCREASPEIADQGRLRFEVGETLRATVSQLFVQYRSAGSSIWNEGAASGLYEVGGLVPLAVPPATYFDLSWDPEPIVGQGDVELRLRAIDVFGTEHFSSIVQLRVRRQLRLSMQVVDVPAIPAGRTPPENDLFGQAVVAGAIEPGLGLYLIATLESSVPPQWVASYLRSDEDPRYPEWRRFDPVFVLADGESRRYLFAVPDWRLCTAYEGYASARIPGDPAVELETEPTAGDTPCFTVELDLDAERAARCGDPGPGTLLASVYVDEGAPSELQLLTLSRLLADDSEELLESVVQPVEGSYGFEIPTAAFEEGVHGFLARLSALDGTSFESRSDAVVDRLDPIVEITSPAEGQSLCTAEIEIVPGVFERGIELFGTVDEPNRLDARLGTGSGDEPLSWTANGQIQWLSSDSPTPFRGVLTDPPAGATTLRLATWDASGNLGCAARTVTVDSEVGASASLSLALISPDGDGVLDETVGQLLASEPLTLDVTVHPAHFDGGCSCWRVAGPAVRHLLEGVPVLDSRSVAWAGEDDGSLPVPDGDYGLLFEATDGCGNSWQKLLPVEVDRTPPETQIVSPLPSDPLPMIVPVHGIAADRNFLELVLEFGAGSDPSTWIEIGTSTLPAPAPGRWLESWNTFGLDGEFTLRLRARDEAGLVSEHRFTYVLTGGDELVSELEAVPELFSPNGDGRREVTSVRVAVVLESRLTLAIRDRNGALVRTLAVDELTPPGTVVFPWDGATDGGTPAPDADYGATLLAELASNPLITQEEEILLSLDRTPPAVTIERPHDGFASGSGEVIGSIGDDHLLAWSVALTDQPDDPVWQELSSGTAPQTSAPLGSLEGLAEGEYALRVLAADAAENESEQILPFAIDNTPPLVALTAPAEGSLLGGALGAVAIRGAIEEENLSEWRLELGAGSAPTEWTLLVASSEPPTGDTLLEWLPTGFPDGLYALRLVALDFADHEAEARVAVELDNAPPQVAISAPAAGDWVREPAPILGTAADPHLESYTLAVAPAGGGEFSPIGGGAASVTDGELLFWSSLPLDGDYRLRLVAFDGAGNESAVEVPVSVDTHPPAAPSLSGELENGADARLDWSASPEPDVVGYVVDRNGERRTPAPIVETTYLDAGLPEGSFTFVVRAVDQAGWEGEPSNAVELVVDRTPPVAVLVAPSDGEPVSGLVAVEGTAHSEGDFREYRVIAEPLAGGTPQLVHSSPAPVLGGLLATWSTLGLPEGESYRLRLEAEDLSGNVGEAEVEVTVDNLAPGTPTGLAAEVVTGTSDVQVSWNPNPEPDLLGYLLERDGVLVNAPAGGIDDLRDYALTGTSYLDPARPDGSFAYRVSAIDRAGNVSAPSASVTVDIDLHPPRATIVVPADGTEFEHPLYVRADTDDGDVAQVAFELRPLAGAWTAIEAPDTTPPWEATLDPLGFEPDLELGDYELRAVATDQGGATDPDPPTIVVTYTDLTPPDPPLGLTALVDGGDVQLDWIAGGEPDLDGYHLERRTAPGDWIRLTADPLPLPAHLDSGVDDGAHEYRVLAVDTFGNESNPSAPVAARVATPELTQPWTPTRSSTVDLAGTSAYTGSAEGEILNDLGTTPIAPVATDGEGGFAWSGLPLAAGANTLRVRVTDPDGHRTRWAEVPVRVGTAPTAPTGLVASPGVGDHDVVLSWNPNPEPDLAGYLPSRDGERRIAGETIADGAATASSAWGTAVAARAIDGDPATWWAPRVLTGQPVAGQWIEVSWPAVRMLRSVDLTWIEEPPNLYAPAEFDLEAWFDGVWVPIARYRDVLSEHQTWSATDLYPTDRIRVLLHRSLLGEGFYQPIRLAELAVEHQPLEPGTGFEETAPDGEHEYRVRAVGALGFESAPSEPATIAVGDVTPPDPVVLTAAVAGSDVELSWTESPAPDLARYDVWRDGAKIGERTDLGDRTWLDAARPNGTYAYVVVAVDAVGNESDPSNQEVVTVAVAPPGAPTDLAAAPVAGGGALDLAWQPPAGPAPAGYRVHRAQVSGGPYEPVAETAATSHRDSGLLDGTTYYYVVTALDAAGNSSGPSNEASGTPSDAEAPPPPAITYPAAPGLPRIVRSSPVVVAGFAEPGTEVELRRNEVYLGETVAAAELGIEAYSQVVFGSARPSPDARWIWIEGLSNDGRLIDLESDTWRSVPGGRGAARWESTGRFVHLSWDDEARRYDVETESLEVLTSAELLGLSTPSPDGQRLALTCRRGGQSGVWIYEIATGAWSLAAPVVGLETLGAVLEWSPDGAHLALLRTDGAPRLEIVEVATATPVATLPATGEIPSWAPDGSALLWTSDADGSEQVWIHELASGTSAALTAGPGAHARPQWSPDGRGFLHVEDGVELLFRDLASGLDEAWDLGFASVQQLSWTASGAPVLIGQYAPYRLTPPGRFALAEVDLLEGDNRFVALARDGAGNVSEPSQPALVHLVGGSLPNLTLLPSDLVVLPAVPLAGSTARVTAVVRNLGGASAPATELGLVATGPGGFSLTLAGAHPVPPLGPGQAASFGFDLPLPPIAGSYVVTGIVDASDQVAESNESDNLAQRTFPVAELEVPQLELATDRTVYAGGEPVGITATLTNAGPSFDGLLELVVEDAAGYLVETLEPEPVIELGYGESRVVDRTWSSASVFAGTYQVRARLLDAGGAEVASAVAPFDVGEVIYLSATVATDRPVYTVGQSARLAGQIRYDAGNAVLSGAVAELEVSRAGAGVVASWTQGLGDLLPGSTSSVVRTLASAGLEAGGYEVRFRVLRGAELLAAALVPFQLVAEPALISGALELSNPQPALGETLVAAYEVANRGGEDAFGVPLRVRLLEPDAGTELDRFETVVDLPAGAIESGSASFGTEGLELGTYLVLLEVDWLVDGSPETLVLDAESFATADRTPPLVTLLQPEPGGFVGADLHARVGAVDQHSHVVAVEVSIDAGGWSPLALEDAAQGIWGAALDPLPEGAHELRARARDAWDNLAELPAAPFEVDLTAPVVTVTGVEEGGVYTEPVAALIEVADPHPGWTVATLDGFTYVSGTPIDEPGAHTLRVVAEDGAGNRTVVEVHFTLETQTVPEISVDDAEIVEGDAGQSDLVFTLSLSAPAAQPVTLDVWTVDETALAGEDYLALAATATFAPGETERPVAVPVLGDLLLEPDQTFRLELGEPSFGTLADASGLGTILDDELCPGPELLANPGAEDPLAEGELPGWTEVVGSSWQPRTAAPEPAEGSAYFFAGQQGLAELAQEVDVSAYAAAIDAGGQLFEFAARLRSGDEVPADPARVVVEYRDELGAVLDELDSGEITATDAWTEVADLRAAPFGTRSIVVRLIGVRVAGTDLDAYFDALSLRSLRAAAFTVGDVALDEPEGGAQLDALFPVALSCPLDRPVALDFATRDGSALAGFDYLATSGSLELPAGATAAQVAVPVLGDGELENDESFFLDFAGGAGAVLVDPEGEARIHDPGCLASPLSGAGEFGLFLFGDLVQNGSDAEGRVAAGGDVQLNSYSVGAGLPGPSGDVLVAGGSLIFNWGTVHHGDVVYGSTATLQGVDVPDGTVRQGTPIDFGAAAVELEDLSLGWDLLAVNGTTAVTPWGEITLSGTDPVLDVFDLAAADLLTASSLTIQVPAGATALVNVDGTAVVAQAFGFALEGVGPERVLFNLPQASSLILQSVGFRGSVLAPFASVQFNGGVIEGSLVAVSLAGNGQSNRARFDGCLPPPGPPPFCPRSPGYWKNHPEAWPVDQLELGGVLYDANELMALLNYGGPDAASKLARALTATLLNVESGFSHPDLPPLIAAADEFLVDYPPGSNPRGAAKAYANGLKDQLESFYEGAQCDGGETL